MEIAVQGPGAALMMVIANTAARCLALKRHSVMLLPCIAKNPT